MLLVTGIAFVVGAVLVSYTFDALLPDDVRFWTTIALSVIALGCFLLSGASLAGARAGDGPDPVDAA